MGILEVATLLGGIAIVWGVGRWALRRVQEWRRTSVERANAAAAGKAHEILSEKTYYNYRATDCPALLSPTLVAHLEGRYKCQALVVGAKPLPVTVLWKSPSAIIPPDAVLGEFDPAPPRPLLNSPIFPDPKDYNKAREFIREQYETPPSMVRYEGCDYRMVSIDLSGAVPLVNGAFGLYYDNILTQYAMEWELKKAILRSPADLAALDREGTLPLREAVERLGNPLVHGASRCAAITVSTLVVFLRSDGARFTIVRRRSSAVGVSPGLHHVVPSGMFEAPNTEDTWSLSESIWRELLEELYNEEEQIGKGRSEIKDYIRAQPPIKLLRDLIRAGRAELAVTGIGCDLLTLRPEICTVLYVPNSSLAEAREMQLNWEYQREGPTGTFGVQWSHLPALVEDLTSKGSLVVSGAACLELGRDWLRRRHGI
jgi:hypothetical protein